jgi:hypothetical protein
LTDGQLHAQMLPKSGTPNWLVATPSPRRAEGPRSARREPEVERYEHEKDGESLLQVLC